jgi:hypothetical protein
MTEQKNYYCLLGKKSSNKVFFFIIVLCLIERMKRRTESKNENEWVSTTLMKACGKIGKQTKRKDKEREKL